MDKVADHELAARERSQQISGVPFFREFGAFGVAAGTHSGQRQKRDLLLRSRGSGRTTQSAYNRKACPCAHRRTPISSSISPSLSNDHHPVGKVPTHALLPPLICQRELVPSRSRLGGLGSLRKSGGKLGRHSRPVGCWQKCDGEAGGGGSQLIWFQTNARQASERKLAGYPATAACPSRKPLLAESA